MEDACQFPNQSRCIVLVNRLLERLDVGPCREKPALSGQNDGFGPTISQSSINSISDLREKGTREGLRRGLSSHRDNSHGATLLNMDAHRNPSQFDVDV